MLTGDDQRSLPENTNMIKLLSKLLIYIGLGIITAALLFAFYQFLLGIPLAAKYLPQPAELPGLLDGSTNILDGLLNAGAGLTTLTNSLQVQDADQPPVAASRSAGSPSLALYPDDPPAGGVVMVTITNNGPADQYRVTTDLSDRAQTSTTIQPGATWQCLVRLPWNAHKGDKMTVTATSIGDSTKTTTAQVAVK